MFAPVAFTTLLASTAFLTARADVPQPNSPAPNTIFKVGGQCTIGWTPDTTGTWTEMYIELNTGDNFDMKHLTTVTKVDGTDASVTTYTWTCPNVTPNSNIYFYQFSSPVSTQPSWTGRFTIASASGATTPPTNATQPGGAALPWGTGAYVDPTQATPPPYNSPKGANLDQSPGNSTTGTGNGTATSPASSAAGSVAASSGSTPSSSIQHITVPTSTTTLKSTSTSKPANSTSGAFTLRVQQAFIALSVAAVGFAVAL